MSPVELSASALQPIQDLPRFSDSGWHRLQLICNPNEARCSRKWLMLDHESSVLFCFFIGRHCDVHQMTGNYMWEESSGKEFLIGTNDDSRLPLWWNGSEPLWVTLQKLGKKVFMYYWPGAYTQFHPQDHTLMYFKIN